MTKRIIQGKTYNTETATCIAKYEATPYPDATEFDDLYQNRHGVYFQYHGDYARTWGDVEDIKPLTPIEAREWMENRSFTNLIEEHFGEQPEAGESESRFTLRMPDSLKSKIDVLAGKNNQSTNAWVVRCLEQCVACQRI